MLPNVFTSLHRTRSAADLALLVSTSPHPFTVRQAAAEAADRAPHVAQVLHALADRLARSMRDLEALERQAAAAPAPTPIRAKRARKTAASAAAGLPETLPPEHLPMPQTWEELTPAQLAWFERWRPIAFRNRALPPAKSYATAQSAIRSRWGKRLSWAERFAAAQSKGVEKNRLIDAELEAKGYQPAPDFRRMSRAEIVAAFDRGTRMDPLRAV